MAEFPKIAPLDGKAVENALKTSVRKPDGSAYAAFDQVQEYVASTRAVRDAAAATHAGVFGQGGVKKDVDQNTSDLANLKSRVAALEAQPDRPFPA